MKKRNYFKVKRPYVFVPMCLDFLHHGHANILRKSKKFGNIILGLVSDKGIKSYKKNFQPVHLMKEKKLLQC